MAQIPTNSRCLYRIMTEKSIIGFGKYGDMRIGDILKIDPTYIAWAYYNYPMVSFKDDILEALGCEKISKPGISEETWKNWKRKQWEGLSQEEIDAILLRFRMAGKRVRKAKLAQAVHNTTFTKGQLQAMNHGKFYK